MTAAELAAILTAAAGLVAAVVSLVRALQTSRQLQAHIRVESASIARAARQRLTDTSDGS